jgi:hypothetical protein
MPEMTKEQIYKRDAHAAKLLRLECIRQGFVQPRDGDPDEKRVWDDGLKSRSK